MYRLIDVVCLVLVLVDECIQALLDVKAFYAWFAPRIFAGWIVQVGVIYTWRAMWGMSTDGVFGQSLVLAGIMLFLSVIYLRHSAFIGRKLMRMAMRDGEDESPLVVDRRVRPCFVFLGLAPTESAASLPRAALTDHLHAKHWYLVFQFVGESILSVRSVQAVCELEYEPQGQGGVPTARQDAPRCRI